MIIGVTGMYASGKDTVAEFLEQNGFVHLSLSDEIREELRRKKKKITRENLIAEGNRLREAFGASVLAQKAKMKLRGEKTYVITSIRNPEEVKSLREKEGFVLVAVKAPQKQRFEWLSKRARKGDPVTFEEFADKEKREQSSDPAKQQLHKVMKMAKIVVLNNGTLNDLKNKTQQLVYDLRSKRKRPSFPQIYTQLARTMAQRSTCLRLQVGTVITSTDFRQVLAVGYNGNASGLANRCDRTTPGKCGCVHSEENAVINCAVPRSVEKFVFVTHIPCVGCAKRLINLGNVKRVYYAHDYRIKDSVGLLKQVGIDVRKV